MHKTQAQKAVWSHQSWIGNSEIPAPIRTISQQLALCIMSAFLPHSPALTLAPAPRVPVGRCVRALSAASHPRHRACRQELHALLPGFGYSPWPSDARITHTHAVPITDAGMHAGRSMCLDVAWTSAYLCHTLESAWNFSTTSARVPLSDTC